MPQEAAENPEVDDGWRRVRQVCEQHSARARKVTAEFYSGCDMCSWSALFMCLCGEYKVYRKGAREQGGGCCHLKNGVDLVATNEEKRTRGQVEPAGCAALCTSVHLDWIQEGEFPTLQGRIETKGKRVHARGISQQMVHTQEGERVP